MLQIVIPPGEKAELRRLARSTSDVHVALRIRVIFALAEGWSVTDVARLFMIDGATASRWKRAYEERELFSDWLATRSTGYKGKLTRAEKREVARFVDAEVISDARQVVDFVKRRYAKVYSVNGATKLLHKLGFVYKQTTLIPGKLDEVAQAAFAKKYEEKRDNLPVDEVILFADGVHPTHNVNPTKAWVRRGRQKQVRTNSGRKRLNINGLLDVNAMRAVTLFSNSINAQATIELFEKAEARYADKSVIHIIADNALYYKNKDVAEWLARSDCRVKLDFLPPYSPNLNLIERLWRFMKKDAIGAERREKFKDFEADIRAFFDNMGSRETELRRFIGTEMHLIKLE